MHDIIVSLTWITKIHFLVHDIHHADYGLVLHLHRNILLEVVAGVSMIIRFQHL